MERQKVVLPIGCISPPPPTHPGAESDVCPTMPSRKQRDLKNLILVGTIIMLVALVRHVFRYLSSSPVTTGT